MTVINRDELREKIAELANKANELKAEIKTLSELKSPQELKDAAEYSARGFRAVLLAKRRSEQISSSLWLRLLSRL